MSQRPLRTKEDRALRAKMLEISSTIIITKSTNGRGYKYASLDNDILPALNPFLTKHKLYVEHYSTVEGVVTEVTDLENGAYVSSLVPYATREANDVQVKMTAPQKLGSEITYYKRYNIGQLFNLSLGDDTDADLKDRKAKQVAEMNPHHMKKIEDFKNDIKVYDSLFGTNFMSDFLGRNNLTDVALSTPDQLDFAQRHLTSNIAKVEAVKPQEHVNQPKPEQDQPKPEQDQPKPEQDQPKPQEQQPTNRILTEQEAMELNDRLVAFSTKHKWDLRGEFLRNCNVDSVLKASTAQMLEVVKFMESQEVTTNVQ